MTEYKPEFWERNSAGELISQPFTIIVANDAILSHINSCLEKSKIEIDEKKKEVLKRAAELLQEEYDKTKITIDTELLPLLSGEIRCLIKGDKYNCVGELVSDQDADICSRKCLSPKYTFEQWRDIKDSRIKTVIANKIRDISYPPSNQRIKEVFQMLREL